MNNKIPCTFETEAYINVKSSLLTVLYIYMFVIYTCLLYIHVCYIYMFVIYT